MSVKDHADEIIRRFRDGETMARIGESYGVTREYIRQILCIYGIKKEDGGAHVRSKKRTEARAKRRREKFIKKYGMTRAEYRRVNKNIDSNGGSPIVRYNCQKSAARNRGIEWDITFAEWWAIWEPHWENRGRYADGLVMARHGDSGPYHPSNVKIITLAENASEQYLYR